MQQPKMRKTMMASLLMLALAAMITVGSTMAYLSDRSTDDVKYVIGDVKISVEEGTIDGKYYKQVGKDKLEAYLVPGQYIPRNPQVKVDSSSEDCYVRLKVTIDPDLAKVIKVPEAVNGWTRVDRESNSNIYYYNCPDKLKKGGTSTAAFDKILVLSNPTLTGGKTHEDMLEAAKGQKVTVVAQAIQSDGVESTAKAFEIMDGYFTR